MVELCLTMRIKKPLGSSLNLAICWKPLNIKHQSDKGNHQGSITIICPQRLNAKQLLI